jgi:hypothetical protein
VSHLAETPCPQPWPLPNLDPEQLLLVVVGAHPKAEVADRVIAAWVREQMLVWLDKRFGPRDAEGGTGGHPCTVMLCTDVWYLNDQDLRECPVISVGGPGVNALSTALGGRIPSAFVVDNVLVVQVDTEFEELRACCWGMGTRQTSAAAQVFVEKYLNGFMTAATERWAMG